MRLKKRVQLLEMQLADLQSHLEQVYDVVTTPTQKTITTNSNWRSKPRKKVITANRQKRWTNEDVELVVRLRQQGVSHAEIGRLLGRSGRAVSGLLNRRGLS
jgi:hypothetical protein